MKQLGVTSLVARTAKARGTGSAAAELISRLKMEVHQTALDIAARNRRGAKIRSPAPHSLRWSRYVEVYGERPLVASSGYSRVNSFP
jgi:hypothetical protein